MSKTTGLLSLHLFWVLSWKTWRNTVQFSSSVVSDSLWPHRLQHTRPLSITNSQSPPKPMSIELMDIQPSHPLSSPFHPAFNLSQHQGLFQWVGSLHQVVTELELQLQHQSFQWIIQGWLPLGWTGLSSLLPKGLSKESSPALQFKSINSLALSLLYGLALTSIHDYWKNHSFDYMGLCWQSEVSAF